MINASCALVNQRSKPLFLTEVYYRLVLHHFFLQVLYRYHYIQLFMLYHFQHLHDHIDQVEELQQFIEEHWFYPHQQLNHFVIRQILRFMNLVLFHCIIRVFLMFMLFILD